MRTRNVLAPIAAIGFAIAAATPALAQDPSQAAHSLYINGTAPAACVVRGASASGGQNAAFVAIDASHGQITITQLVNAQTAEPQASAIRIALPVVCNASHRVTITSSQGGLLRAGSQRNRSQGGFAEFLPYRIGLGWAGTQLEQGSDAGALVIDSANGSVGDLSLQVTTPGGGTPLIAGQYDDSLIIQFQPAN